MGMSYRDVRNFVDRYFYRQFSGNPRRKLGDREKKLLLSPTFLREKCTYSLKERAEFIKSKFPEAAVSASVIQRLYKAKKVRFKKVI